MTPDDLAALNRRRADLIRLAIAGSITGGERLELEALQRESFADLQWPPDQRDEIDRLKMSITTRRPFMTRDELQTQTLKDCDRITGLSRWLISTDERNRATAQRSYWQTARPPELDRLLSLMPHGEAVGAGPVDDVTDLLAWLRGTGTWQAALKALADLIYWVSQQIPDGVTAPSPVAGGMRPTLTKAQLADRLEAELSAPKVDWRALLNVLLAIAALFGI